MKRLTCESCKRTLGYLSKICSNHKCNMYGIKQIGILRPYKDLILIDKFLEEHYKKLKNKTKRL